MKFLRISLDLMNEEVEKVIVQPTETVVPLLGRMKFVTAARRREPEALLDHEQTLGYHHQIEGMGAHEVGHHHTGAAHVLLREETLVHTPTKDGDPHQEGSRPESRPEEMKGPDHRPKNGAQNPPTVMVDHTTDPVLATAQDGYAIQPLAAKSSDPRDETGLLVQAEALLPQSPIHPSHRGHPRDAAKRDRTLSPSTRVSPAHALASQPALVSRCSSPDVEKPVVISRRSRSRSPIRSPVPLQRSSKSSGRSPYRDQVYDTEFSHPQQRQDHEDRVSFGNHSPFSIRAHLEPQTRGTQVGGNIPTQPKNHSASPLPLPPSGPYQGPRPPSNQHRGPSHASLLSAPTRPRRGPGPREAWTGSPPVRRGPVAASHAPPAGPRASFSSPVPGGSYRHPTSRQPNTPSVTQPLAQKGVNHLAGLCTIVPEGRSLPSLLDPTVEKRLAQLDADKEKLLEQIAETQRSKRAGLRDWDRLDRESSICALKSELAEGHLQRMADESIGSGNLF
ncbi:hypothetical protein N7497_003514 [Penicillium chrysogenum]|uniref:Serine/arginine repetitive matrix protein 1-like n=1 Tax=Penicillium chrysogenum TaxID=5076 RepID=A0ABQ8WBR2_PENCH|nr:hypothetical protein N7505_008002 [Penicillium chrysogenum]KAJ6163535.1 hypothetical protein N7497_003514 [Penicillium chrysogenum]